MGSPDGTLDGTPEGGKVGTLDGSMSDLMSVVLVDEVLEDVLLQPGSVHCSISTDRGVLLLANGSVMACCDRLVGCDCGGRRVLRFTMPPPHPQHATVLSIPDLGG